VLLHIVGHGETHVITRWIRLNHRLKIDKRFHNRLPFNYNLFNIIMDEGEFRQNELLNEEDPEQANLIVDKYQQSDEIKGVVPKLADDHERA
jgi:hypothetical protein